MMKKIFALVFLLVLGKFSYSQSYPISQNLGSDSTIVISKGALQSRLIPIIISDTATANNQRLKNYPGAQLYTSNGDFYIRNATATKWLLLSSGSVGAVNIYNSNGTLTGNRTLQGNGKDLLFDNVNNFSAVATQLQLAQNGGTASFYVRGDTSSFVNRASYEENYGSTFTKHSLVDKNYVDSSISIIPAGGTVTSVATNNGTGITGGTITPVNPTEIPDPYDFEVTGSSIIPAGATNATLSAFIGFNVLFVRNGIPQSSLNLNGDSYFSWNKALGIITIHPAAITGEIFQIYPI